MTAQLARTAATAPRKAPSSAAPIGIALASAAAFSTSGPFAKSLLNTGWSPAAAVTARIALAALVLAIPTARALRGRWHLLRSRLPIIAIYGLTGVAGCQLAYFNAIEHLSVGVALLLEYLSPVLLIGLFWVRHRRSPGRLTLAGAALCIGGLVLVLDVFNGVHISLVGVAWGLGAAVCSAAYFLLSSRADEDFPPIALAGTGMVVGALFLVALGAVGVTPMHATTSDVVFAGRQVSFLLPLLGISVLAAAFAYAAGVVSARLLGARVASFVALAEVLFAVLFAWLLLGQLPLPVQLAGGALIVVGVVLVRSAEVQLAD
ncbi:EamA family transporter [Leekyejoonella antrihumi]|uniref:EamA family transporter n=1 Tax=Leekyejoonella antrihumi TaxID=1660198 RepID=UPI001FE3F429|nr:DMT family transporter [Leekyejoonella antrihumi]